MAAEQTSDIMLRMELLIIERLEVSDHLFNDDAGMNESLAGPA